MSARHVCVFNQERGNNTHSWRSGSCGSTSLPEPVDSPYTSPPPPRITRARWQRLVDAGRHFDSIANRGAGAPKDAG